MKNIGKIIIIYSILMLMALGIIILIWYNTKEVSGTVGSYNAEELEMYKKIHESMDADKVLLQNRMLSFTMISWGMLLILGYGLIFMIYRFLIKPVKEMEEYASEIAKGNLEVKLPIHRDNMFGNFTESFDMMREELKASRERELDAEKAKREMVAELSHDLKTPVATIKATCEVLDMRYKKELERLEKTLKTYGDTYEEKQRINGEIEVIRGNIEKIGYIYNKSELINELVATVFHATLDDIREIEIVPRENESKIIERYFGSLREYGNIILDNSIPECLVYFDKLRMEQVIDNIVGNSYKYAGTDIHVSFSEQEMPSADSGKKDVFLKINIKDNGPGVPDEELPLLAEKFHRGTNSKDKPGYGLGMYLANHYMEKQGGGMEFYNDNGFVVELLVKKV
ncbi:MAG: HAMP domain-containing histidine kinase [Lachnospiraceae bacterium]|nr:HAMP domain-containing histidine kinase [Lachnospiraceae bacterium]